MRIIYNGVDLQAQDTVEYAHEPVYDDTGTDYLYTRHAITCRVVVNGQAEVTLGTGLRNGPFLAAALGQSPAGGIGGPVENGALPPGQKPAVDAGVPGMGPGAAAVGPAERVAPNAGVPRNLVAPGIEPGATGLAAGVANRLRAVVQPAAVTPFTTVEAVRHRLTTPRGRLYVFSGGWDGTTPSPVLLVSPAPGYRTDCNNGPKPKVFNLTRAFGDATTFLADFAVETFVSDADLNMVNDPGALLSNRFSQRHLIDADGYTTVVTAGVALFRTDLVYKLPKAPDADRPVLFMPVPQGFVREVIDVRGLPDVTGVAYSYADRQVPVNFPAGQYVKAASIAAVHRQALLADGSLLEGALTTYERILGMAANRHIAKAPGAPPARANTPQPGQPGSAIRNFGE